MTRSYALTQQCRSAGCEKMLRACNVAGYCSKHRGESEYQAGKKTAWRLAHPREHRDAVLRKRFGITLLDAEAMLARQGFACAICQCALIALVNNHRAHVDHNHDTGEVRGILCEGCNKGLGHFRESTRALVRAINYLSKDLDND